MSSRADSRVGTDFSQLGATSSTWASTFEPRTAAARFGWSEEVSGVANIHAATSTATNLQSHADDRVERAQCAVAQGAAHRAAQHHTGDLTDHHQREDQEQRDEQLGAGAADVADDMRRQQHAGDRAENHPDERQQGAERAGTPSGDGSDERDREDGKVKPL